MKLIHDDVPLIFPPGVPPAQKARIAAWWAEQIARSARPTPKVRDADQAWNLHTYKAGHRG